MRLVQLIARLGPGNTLKCGNASATEQTVKRSMAIGLALAALGVWLGPAAAVAGTRSKPPTAAHRCATHSANGTGVSLKIAKFQVYEGVLKSAGSGLWATWMATGATPGYVVKNLKYQCAEGKGLGFGCSGRAKVCKL